MEIPENVDLEAYNFYRDPRVRATYVAPPEDGTKFDWEVCPLCRGRGTVVNPNIDAGGVDMGWRGEDPDFHDDYINGVYDVACPQCLGRTTVATRES